MERALIGYGGHAREIMSQMGCCLTCFVDDEFVCEHTRPLSEFDHNKYEVMVAVGDSMLRRQLVSKLPANTTYFTFIHPTALIMDLNISVGEGSFIGANCILTTNIKLGKHALLNRSNHLSHDCSIGDFFSAMPCAVVSGSVSIGDNVYLGANSCIKEKIAIRDNIIIGMCAAVVTNINEPGCYVGIPAHAQNVNK